MDGMTETDLPPTESGTVSGMIAGTFHYTLAVSVVQCVCVCVRVCVCGRDFECAVVVMSGTSS